MVLFNVVPQITDIVAATTYLALHLEASSNLPLQQHPSRSIVDNKCAYCLLARADADSVRVL